MSCRILSIKSIMLSNGAHVSFAILPPADASGWAPPPQGSAAAALRRSSAAFQEENAKTDPNIILIMATPKQGHLNLENP